MSLYFVCSVSLVDCGCFTVDNGKTSFPAFGTEVAIRADLETFISFYDYQTRADVKKVKTHTHQISDRCNLLAISTPQRSDMAVFQSGKVDIEQLTAHFQSCVNESAVRVNGEVLPQGSSKEISVKDGTEVRRCR